jgi:hypothetical protein
MNAIPPILKTQEPGKPRQSRRLILCIVAIGVLVGAIGAGTSSKQDFVAHEWGTFTSVQSGDGELLDWRPLQTSKLPGFVYDWSKPGLKRQSTSLAVIGKSSMVTLQRLETPVIYFYSGKQLSVDVSVDFPRGLITEWYPQASQIGPSSVPPTPVITKLDKAAHGVGAKPEFTFASFMGGPDSKDSRAVWTHVQLLPSSNHAELVGELPLDRSGSHYFAARDTDSAYLQLDSLDSSKPGTEYEKFLFYRGTGHFSTPLRAGMNSEHTVTLQNFGDDAISDLFVLGISGKSGRCLHVANLGAGEKRTVELNMERDLTPISSLQPELADQMAAALAAQGLYPREATAMVNTWKDSWLAEEGLRVLYTLPRYWTDTTLPLNIRPVPKELVRVMVGRAEILSPEHEHKLLNLLTRSAGGDDQARAEAIAEIKRLGRFAEPALRLALKGSTPAINQNAWTLLSAANAQTSQRAL